MRHETRLILACLGSETNGIAVRVRGSNISWTTIRQDRWQCLPAAFLCRQRSPGQLLSRADAEVEEGSLCASLILGSSRVLRFRGWRDVTRVHPSAGCATMIGTKYAEEGLQSITVGSKRDGRERNQEKRESERRLDNYKLQPYYSWRGGIFKRGEKCVTYEDKYLSGSDHRASSMELPYTAWGTIISALSPPLLPYESLVQRAHPGSFFL
jgi:hypothetical protein